MAAAVGLTIIKKFTYRGNANEEWSNQYWFSGSVPADDAAWLALFNALAAQEKTVYGNSVFIVAGYGYDSDADNAHAVWTHDLSAAPIAGTGSLGAGGLAAGDLAGLIAWKTSRRNTHNKAIYLRKYFHGVESQAAPNADKVDATQLAAYNALALKLYDGTFIDGRTLQSRKHAETLTTHVANQWITTRTLKRRGKRPH